MIYFTSDFTTASINGVYLALMHYPMLSWPKKNSGSLQLHGHIHADKAYNLENLANVAIEYDFGVSQKYRFESFCYGPKICKIYKRGRQKYLAV